MNPVFCTFYAVLILTSCLIPLHSQLWNEMELKNWMTHLRSLPEKDAEHVVQILKNNVSKSDLNIHGMNLKGLIAYSEGRFLESLGNFETACQLVNFTDGRLLSNWLDVWYTIDVSNPIPKLRVFIRKYPDSVPLLQSIIDELRRDTSIELYSILIDTLKALPTWYEFWIVFVDLHLNRYFIKPISSNSSSSNNDSVSGSGINNSNTFGEFDLVQYALSLFPRSPELNLLRAVHAVAQGSLKCGEYFAQKALAYIEYDMGVVPKKYYEAVVATTVSYEQQQQQRENENSNNRNGKDYYASACSSFITHHTMEDYQQHYKLFTDVMGAGWSALPNMSVPAGTEPGVNTLVRFAVSFFLPDGKHDLQAIPSLQIGCTSFVHCARPGFMIADIVPSVVTHFVAPAYNLSMIEGSSVGLIYASYTLSHLSYQLSDPSCPDYPRSDIESTDPNCLSEVDRAFKEFRRVLVKGGRLLISEADFAALAAAIRHPGATAQDKFRYMELLFGHHADVYDMRKSGFHYEMLSGYLRVYGFCSVSRVAEIGIFKDQSMRSDPPSLNIVAVAC